MTEADTGTMDKKPKPSLSDQARTWTIVAIMFYVVVFMIPRPAYGTLGWWVWFAIVLCGPSLYFFTNYLPRRRARKKDGNNE